VSGVAVVTGGGRGIGWATAQRLLDDGMRVVVADVEPGDAATARAGLSYAPLDVRDRDGVDAAFADVRKQHGSLDVLVNNAGVQRVAPTESMSWDDWSAVIDVNLHGTFNCLQSAGRIMLDAGAGAVVNLTSVLAARGAPGRIAYTATKSATVGMTRVAAVEWASRGVRVNAVGPGYVDTTLLRAAVADGVIAIDDILDRVPQRRLASPAEVAATVSFLVSTESSYITGQTFYVDGGLLADNGLGGNPGGPHKHAQQEGTHHGD
jgi:3-oxoacyl-[acyl-carrier protein] reductase